MRTLLVVAAVLAAAPAVHAQGNAALVEQVRLREAAFAKTMADRDHAAFSSFLADEAIFVAPSGQALHGRAKIAEGWKRYYEGPAAPFAWAPETVVVVDSGTLALSSGPVFAPDGRRAGTFNSVWRREKDGGWKIVLDNGCPRCECPPAAASPSPAASTKP